MEEAEGAAEMAHSPKHGERESAIVEEREEQTNCEYLKDSNAMCT